MTDDRDLTWVWRGRRRSLTPLFTVRPSLPARGGADAPALRRGGSSHQSVTPLVAIIPFSVSPLMEKLQGHRQRGAAGSSLRQLGILLHLPFDETYKPVLPAACLPIYGSGGQCHRQTREKHAHPSKPRPIVSRKRPLQARFNPEKAGEVQKPGNIMPRDLIRQLNIPVVHLSTRSLLFDFVNIY